MKILDLFSGAGGCAMGYHQALTELGIPHEITGVDIRPMPRYPFRFVQGDALEYLAAHGSEYDFIHASPPCQAYTQSAKQWRVSGKEYPDLVTPTRCLLVVSGKPWVIENVPETPLLDPVELCGTMFGLRMYRHRIFESSPPIPQLPHPEHAVKQVKMGRPVKDGDFIQAVGHFSGVPYARKVMGIDWMTQGELAQAIPPAYCKFIGLQIFPLIAGDDRRGGSSLVHIPDISAYPDRSKDYPRNTDDLSDNVSCGCSAPEASEVTGESSRR